VTVRRFQGAAGLGPFRDIPFLENHWSRPLGDRSFYWYLTFGDSRELRSAARKCQDALGFPYYDLPRPRDLHLTIDRIAFEDGISAAQLSRVQTAAGRACQTISPFRITLSSLGGTPGAIGFDVSPAQPVLSLRDALRAATLDAFPEAPVKRTGFQAHITIAYANSGGVPADDAIAAVEKVNAEIIPVSATVDEVALVLLERRERSYAWQVISRIPLAGR
jgi:2'-5' RNA ligase